MVSIACFVSGRLDTNCYVLYGLQHAVLIDAGEDTRAIEEFLSSHHLTLDALWLTHSHLDHIAGSARLVAATGADVYVHAHDAPNVLTPGSDGLGCWMECPCVGAVTPLEDAQELCCEDATFRVLHTPGHTPGSVCFYGQGTLFSGDTLFKGAHGLCSFPSSDIILMAQSLQQLTLLPEQTIVCAGHGPQTTIQREKPWMQVRARNCLLDA